jgi:signal transduction histidine kinase
LEQRFLELRLLEQLDEIRNKRTFLEVIHQYLQEGVRSIKNNSSLEWDCNGNQMETQTTTTTHITKRFTKCALCGQGISREKRYCISCQRQMVGASAEIEHEASEALYVDTGSLEVNEVRVPKLGERLVSQGLLDSGMLQFALRVQAERKASGDSIRLGQLLVELGLVTREVLERVAMQQLLQTQKALQQSNRELERRVQESTQQLKGALVKLSELSQLKADFVANLSHELRTPLTILGGYLEMMESRTLGPLTDEQAAAADAMNEASQRLNKLVEDLLQFSEATVGAIPLQLEPISLLKPVDQALYKVSKLAQEREVKLERNLPACLPQVRADRQKLGWVIGEFLENAVKFTPAGGVVTVKAEAQSDKVLVAVSDTGIGIPQHRLEEVFYPFHQLAPSMTRYQGGTGLGLAMAERIIEAHGSKIDVYSQEGRGSHFTFALPAAG